MNIQNLYYGANTTELMQGHLQNFCQQREVLISLNHRADVG